MSTHERNHIAAWLFLPPLAVMNGAVRDLTYGRNISYELAHAISVLPLAALVFGVAVLVAQRWPLENVRAAAKVGTVWLLLTVTFEVVLGVALQVPAREMLAAYDVTRGRVWVLVPLATAVAPALARAWQTRRTLKWRHV